MSTISEPKLRAQYLQMLGVVQYVPRDLQDLQQPDDIQDPVKIKHSGDKALITPSNQAAEITDKMSATQTGIASESSAAAEQVSPQTLSDNVELSLALWQPADDLLICTAVDGDLPDQQQVSLLANIVKAMGQKIATLPQFELISWPPHRNMQGGEPEAREYLSTLIKARVDSKSTKTLLLLGETAGEWLLFPEQVAKVEAGQLPVTEKLTALRVPSLQDMLTDQAFKREAWEIISSYLAAQIKPQ